MTKLHNLSFKDKLIYLWDYYKYYLLGAVFFIFLFLYFVLPIIQNAGQNPLLSIVIIDSNTNARNQTDALQHDLLTALASTDSKDCILIDTSASSSEDSTDSVVKQTMVVSSISENDIVICSKESYERYAAEGAFLPWESVLGDEYNTYASYINGNILYLDQSQYWKNLGYTDYEPVYACILNQAPHTDNIASFVTTLYGNQ